MTLLVILSRRFSRFYDSYVRFGAEDPDALLRISCLVAGLAPEPRLSGVAELISASVVDADKIDYVNRDAYSCGIPVGVDVFRIFLRSGFLKATRDRLIKSGLKENPAAEEILFVVNASGLDTVDEITQARAALYQRVYLHAVTRTAESVYSGALEANALDKNKDVQLADALGLWSISDDVLLPALAGSRIPEVRLRATRLRNRELPKKACVFSSSIAGMHMPLEQIFPRLAPLEAATLKKQVVNTPLENLTAEKISSGIGRQLAQEIRDELQKIVAMVPSEKRNDIVPRKPIQLLELIGSAYMDQVQMDCIVLQNGELLRASQFTNIREQRDAFDIFKAVGFVMCDPVWRGLVLLAARTILCKPREKPQQTALFETRLVSDENEQTVPSEKISFVPRMILDLGGVIRRSGISRSKATAIIEAVTEAGYFDDKPLLAPPVDPEEANIRAIARKLNKFDGQRSWRVTQESIAAFVNQMPPHLRTPMLRALSDKLVFFDRAEIGTSLLAKIAEIGEGDVVALSPNSGTFARRLAEDEAQGNAAFSKVRFHKELVDALSSEMNEPLILVDDNISSATQSRAQFLSWSNVRRDDWPIECQDEDGIFTAAPSAELLRKMQSRPIFVVVCAGRGSADDALRKTIEPLGFSRFEGVRFQHSIEFEPDWPTDLRTYLEEVGVSLIAWSQYRKTADELDTKQRAYCKERAFGYGNVGGLVATGLSVPTATATAIWSPGIHLGSPWMPLMIRQNKIRHLVIG